MKALEGKQVYTEDGLKLLLTDNTLSGIFGEAIDIVRKKLGKCNSCLCCEVKTLLLANELMRDTLGVHVGTFFAREV